MDLDIQKRKTILRKLCVTALFTAIAAVLQFLEFPVPLMPTFIKMDFSELPALLVSFAAGPGWGVGVCFLKNLLHLPFSSSLYVGELCNFLLGAALAFPAGWFYRNRPNRAGALWGCAVGTACMAILSFPINLFLSYPIYCRLFGGEEKILGAYREILPAAENFSLAGCLAVFNLPFTFGKGLLTSLLTLFTYRPLEKMINGAKKSKKSACKDKKKRL